MDKCVICQKEASTTVYEISVCQEHFQAYKADIYRVYDVLEIAQAYRQAKEIWQAEYEQEFQELRRRFSDELKTLYGEYRKRHPDIFLEDGTITLPKKSPSQKD